MISKRFVCLMTSASFLFTSVALPGCAGRMANPISSYLPGDENRSGPALMAEIAQLESDMERLLPGTNKFAYNTVMFVGGLLVIVPFFFMDLKEAEKIEWEAMRVRRNRLIIYAIEKRVDFGGSEPVPIPSMKEMKRMVKEAKKNPSQSKQTNE